MVLSREGRLSVDGRPSNDSSLAATLVTALHDDDEKNQAAMDVPQPAPDTDTDTENENDNDNDGQKILDVAWGRHGKVWMWIGYVVSISESRARVG